MILVRPPFDRMSRIWTLLILTVLIPKTSLSLEVHDYADGQAFDEYVIEGEVYRVPQGRDFSFKDGVIYLAEVLSEAEKADLPETLHVFWLDTLNRYALELGRPDYSFARCQNDSTYCVMVWQEPTLPSGASQYLSVVNPNDANESFEYPLYNNKFVTVVTIAGEEVLFTLSVLNEVTEYFSYEADYRFVKGEFIELAIREDEVR